MNKIVQEFRRPKVLLPVVHCIDADQTNRAIDVATQGGADGVFLINQGGMSITEVLERASSAARAGIWTGVNLLGMSMHDAILRILLEPERTCKVNGLWADDANVDVDDPTLEAMWARATASVRKVWPGTLFGGVAFKYQREVPKERLAAVARRAAEVHTIDVITTSGPATGSPPSLDKIQTLRSAIGDHALAIASGITPENVAAFLPFADAFLVASGIETGFGTFDPARLRALADVIHAPRGSEAPGA